jgi:anti-anti-sigma factor
MEISTRNVDGVTVVAMAGDIDGSTTPLIQQEIDPLIREGLSLLIDMAGVHFMSSYGLRYLLLLKRSIDEAGGQVALTGLVEHVASVMDVTGFLAFFDVYPTLEAALAALKAS